MAQSSISGASTRQGSTVEGTNTAADKPAGAVSEVPEVKNEENAVADAPVEEPPDGGLLAWIQVFASYFLFFNTWYVNGYLPIRGGFNARQILTML